MSRSEIYRARARECIRFADAASDMMSRQHYLQLSIVWNDMANRAELAELLPKVPSDHRTK
jgi:hypothetical protein